MTDRDSTGNPTPPAPPADETVALAAAAHEIKNALGPLGMTLQLAERQLLAGQPIAPADLAFARAQVRRLGGLVDDLLDLTRADLGEIPFRPRPADLRQVLTEAVEVFRRGGRAAKVALELPDGPLAAPVDAGRLVQVMINLLENAARYSPPVCRSWWARRGPARWRASRCATRGPACTPPIGSGSSAASCAARRPRGPAASASAYISAAPSSNGTAAPSASRAFQARVRRSGSSSPPASASVMAQRL